MRAYFVGILLVFGALLSSCSEKTADKEAVARELMELSRKWSAMVAAGELEAAIEYWADDAIMLAPNLPALSGKAAIRDYVTDAASIPGFKITWEPERAYVSDNGDMAYMIERNVIELDGESGEKIITHGKVVTIWRKNPSGEWKNVVDIWNAAPPPKD